MNDLKQINEYLALANTWLEKIENGKDNYSNSALESFAVIAQTYINMANSLKG